MGTLFQTCPFTTTPTRRPQPKRRSSQPASGGGGAAAAPRKTSRTAWPSPASARPTHLSWREAPLAPPTPMSWRASVNPATTTTLIPPPAPPQLPADLTWASVAGKPVQPPPSALRKHVFTPSEQQQQQQQQLQGRHAERISSLRTDWVAENMVFQAPKSWIRAGDRVVSSHRVRTYHCRMDDKGKYVAREVGYCLAIFSDDGMGHLLYEESMASRCQAEE